MRCCRSRASASTTTRGRTCSTTWSTRTTSAATTPAASPRCPGRAWAWKSTWSGSSALRSSRRDGAIRCGATTTAAWRSGELMAPERAVAATATLAIDSRCQLGEGIVWDERARRLYWTDILRSRLWMHAPADGATHAWDLPEPLGCLALCDDGGLLLALAKSIRMADAPHPGQPLSLRLLAALEPGHGAATRSND